MKIVRVLIVKIIILVLFFSYAYSQDIRATRLPSVGDGAIRTEAIWHSENSPTYCIELTPGKFRFMIATAKDDVGRATVVVNGKSYEMKMIQGESRDFYFGDAKVDTPNFSYYFILAERGKNFYVGRSSSWSNSITPFQNSQASDELNADTWAKNQLFYYILLDRFRNGTDLNDTEVQNWGANYSELNQKGYFGGDLLGVFEKTEYLNTLGIQAVELSSPFYAEGIANGSTLDFRHISPELAITQDGGDRLTVTFQTLSKVEKVKKGINPNTLKEEYEEVKSYTTGSATLTLPQTAKNFGSSGSSEVENLAISGSGVNGYGESLDSKTWGYTQSDRLFFATVQALHEKGIKVVLNMNLTSVGKNFFAYHEAILQGPTSAYAHWFYFQDWEKCTTYTAENEDIWNPYVQYYGNASVGVEYIKGAKYRRRWIALSEATTPLEIQEVIQWNYEHVLSRSGELGGERVLLNTSNGEVQTYLMGSVMKWVNGVGQSSGIDGIAFDYPTQLDSNFLNSLSQTILKVKPNFYLVTGLDSTPLKNTTLYHRDYDFPDMLNEFVNEGILKSTVLANQLKVREWMQSVQRRDSDMIPLDSIYTARSFSMTINPEVGFGENLGEFMKISPQALSPNDSIARYKMYLLLSLIRPGNIEMLYGTEFGQFGGVEEAIKPMLWNDLPENELESDRMLKYGAQSVGGNSNALEFPGDVDVDLINQEILYTPKSNMDLYAFVKKAILLHKKYQSLFETGTLSYVTTGDENLFIYQIKDKKETLLVIANRGSAKTVSLEIAKSGVYKSELTGQSYEIKEGKLTLEMAKNGCDILYKVY